MSRGQWGGAALTALCALGCGGRAEEPAQNPDLGIPPGGFYSATWQTLSDSCDAKEPQGTTNELIGAGVEGGVSVVFWQAHRQQPIPWDEPFTFTWNECGVTVTLEVLEKSSHSLVVDRRLDWVNPAPCKQLKDYDLPTFDCAVHQITTYELEQACPTTRHGVSCS
jgi:hypothetical protein